MLLPGTTSSFGSLSLERTSALHIDRYAKADWASVCELLASFPVRALASDSVWPIEKLTGLWMERAKLTLDAKQTDSWIVGSGGTVSGLISLTGLPWDSKHIGMRAARLDYLVGSGPYAAQYSIKRGLLGAGLMHAARSELRHVTIRLDSSDLSGLHAVERAGFITVDNMLTFCLDLSRASIQDRAIPLQCSEGVRFRLATEGDSEGAADLARTAYTYDRFHSDPFISARQADELYAEWLRNSCAGTAADAVLLAEDEKGVLGFVTCKLQRDTQRHLGRLVGTIELIATAGRARRNGIGRSAMYAALSWFRDQQADFVEVGTQLRNIPALRLYESCGFRLAGSCVSLRKHL